MIEMKPDIYWVGVNDRTTDLFEAVWPIPEGISYNSYLIHDEKVALIDTVKSHFQAEFLEKIEEIVKVKEIDYIIINHMEPDHSGALPALRKLAPEVEIVGTAKTEEMLGDFYGITEGIKVIKQGDKIDLGGRTLKFFETPFIHWPETMMTYEQNDKILFSGDAFGGFGALDGGIFDDQTDLDYGSEILRYFSNIVGMYSTTVQAGLRKLGNTPINMVAPTHGPVWGSQPEVIIDLYDKWSRYEAQSGVTLIYGSMYGNTKQLMEGVARGIKTAGCENLKVLDASRIPLSYLLNEAWRNKGLIVGSPTYDSRIFPPVDHFVRLAKKKKLKERTVGIFGSYGWGGGAAGEIKSTAEDLGWELVEPIVQFKGKPTKADLENGEKLGETLAKKVV